MNLLEVFEILCIRLWDGGWVFSLSSPFHDGGSVLVKRLKFQNCERLCTLTSQSRRTVLITSVQNSRTTYSTSNNILLFPYTAPPLENSLPNTTTYHANKSLSINIMQFICSVDQVHCKCHFKYVLKFTNSDIYEVIVNLQPYKSTLL